MSGGSSPIFPLASQLWTTFAAAAQLRVFRLILTRWPASDPWVQTGQ
jgi:hypothetical protein